MFILHPSCTRLVFTSKIITARIFFVPFFFLDETKHFFSVTQTIAIRYFGIHLAGWLAFPLEKKQFACFYQTVLRVDDRQKACNFHQTGKTFVMLSPFPRCPRVAFSCYLDINTEGLCSFYKSLPHLTHFADLFIFLRAKPLGWISWKPFLYCSSLLLCASQWTMHGVIDMEASMESVRRLIKAFFLNTFVLSFSNYKGPYCWC